MLIRNISIVLITLLFFSSCKTKQVVTAAKDGTVLKNGNQYNDFFLAERARIKGDIKISRKLYKSFVAKYQDNATAYYNLSKLEFAAFQFDEAEDHASKAVKLEGNNKYFLKHYADILGLNNKAADAVKIYKRLEQKYPYAAETYIYNQFRIHKKEGEHKEAIKDLNRLENRIGISEEISFQKSELYNKLNQNTKAIAEIQKLIDEDPTNISYKGMLAASYEKNNQKEKAKEVYEQLLKDAPNDPNVLVALSTYYLKQKDTIAYEKTLDEIVTNPDLDAQFKMSILMPLISKRSDSAYIARKSLPLLEKLRSSSPDSKEVDGMYADMLYFSKQYQRAIGAYRTYLKKEKAQFAPWFNLILCYSNLNKLDSMVSVADESLNYFPNNALAHYFKGTGHYQLKEYEKGVKALNNALDVEPEKDLKAQIYSLLGDSYNSMKKYELSDESFTKSLAVKEDATTLNNFAYYLSLRGKDLDKAEKMSKKSLELEPASLTFLDTYGWILYKKGEYIKAKKYIEKAIDPTTGGDPDVLEHLGDIYYKLENKSKALEYWNKAKKAQGGSPLLNKKITEGKLYE